MKALTQSAKSADIVQQYQQREMAVRKVNRLLGDHDRTREALLHALANARDAGVPANDLADMCSINRMTLHRWLNSQEGTT